jgi:hypothetical protein
VENNLLKNMEETFSKCLEIARRKNNDYGGSNSNPYQNFSNSEIVGVSVEKGIMVRMMDKVSRISTLLEKEAQVKDESIQDTLDDLINYTAILKSYLKDKKVSGVYTFKSEIPPGVPMTEKPRWADQFREPDNRVIGKDATQVDCETLDSLREIAEKTGIIPIGGQSKEYKTVLEKGQ